VVDSGGAIPGAADIKLEIGVEGEEFAFRIKGKIDGIAEAGGDHGPILAIGRDAADPAGGRSNADGVAHGIRQGRKEGIFFPDRGLKAWDVLGDGSVVASDEVEGFLILRQDDGVRGMFVAHAELFDEFEFVVLVITVGVPDAIEAFHGRHVEAVKGMEESESAANFAFAPVDGEVGEAFEAFDGSL